MFFSTKRFAVLVGLGVLMGYARSWPGHRHLETAFIDLGVWAMLVLMYVAGTKVLEYIFPKQSRNTGRVDT